MSKKIISRGAKIFMSILLVIGIGCYIGAGVVLYNSNYKVSNYYNEIRDFFEVDHLGMGGSNFSTSYEDVISTNTQSIEIRTSAVDIQVIGVDGNNIRVEIYGDRRVNAFEDVAINLLKQNDSTNNIAISLINEESIRRGTIVVQIPNSYKNNINVSSTSGDILVRNMELKGVTSKNTSGDVEFHNATVDNLNVKTISGDINTQNTKSLSTNFSTTSGDIDLNGEIGDSRIGTTSGEIDFIPTVLTKGVIIETTSGEVNIYRNGITDCGVDFSSVSGSMFANGEKLKVNGGKGSYTLGNGTPNITVKTTSGKLEIK